MHRSILRLIAAFTAVVFSCVTLSPALRAQTTTTVPYTPAPYGTTLNGTTTTTTSANGRTTTTSSEASGTGDADKHDPGTYQTIKESSSVTKDAAGNTLKSESNYELRMYVTKGGKQLESLVKSTTQTYNMTGGYTEHTTTTWVNKDGSTEDTDETTEHDANGTTLSGSRTNKTSTRSTETHEKLENGVWKTATSMLTPVHPSESTAVVSNERAYLPDTAGPHGQILATFDDSSNGGPSGVATIAFMQSDGSQKYYTAKPDANHHVIFNVATGAVAVLLFQALKPGGTPDDRAVRCAISTDAPVQGTDPLPNIPSGSQTAILRASSAYERGGQSNGVIDVQTRGTDPDALVALDGDTSNVQTLAASDRSVKARVTDDTPLGRHVVSIEDGATQANQFPMDLVTLQADAIPAAEPGSTVPLTVHVIGLPDGDEATMDFLVSGAAQLAGGGDSTTVPVEGNTAVVQVRGVRPGAALVKYHLHAKIAGFWS
jgi:hypothetical protein